MAKRHIMQRVFLLSLLLYKVNSKTFGRDGLCEILDECKTCVVTGNGINKCLWILNTNGSDYCIVTTQFKVHSVALSFRNHMGCARAVKRKEKERATSVIKLEQAISGYGDFVTTTIRNAPPHDPIKAVDMKEPSSSSKLYNDARSITTIPILDTVTSRSSTSFPVTIETLHPKPSLDNVPFSLSKTSTQSSSDFRSTSTVTNYDQLVTIQDPMNGNDKVTDIPMNVEDQQIETASVYQLVNNVPTLKDIDTTIESNKSADEGLGVSYDSTQDTITVPSTTIRPSTLMKSNITPYVENDIIIARHTTHTPDVTVRSNISTHSTQSSMNVCPIEELMTCPICKLCITITCPPVIMQVCPKHTSRPRQYRKCPKKKNNTKKLKAFKSQTRQPETTLSKLDRSMCRSVELGLRYIRETPALDHAYLIKWIKDSPAYQNQACKALKSIRQGFHC